MNELYMQLGVSPAVYAYGERTLETLRERFAAVDTVAEYNQAKVIAAMQKNRVGASCFAARPRWCAPRSPAARTR